MRYAMVRHCGSNEGNNQAYSHTQRDLEKKLLQSWGSSPARTLIAVMRTNPQANTFAYAKKTKMFSDELVHEEINAKHWKP